MRLGCLKRRPGLEGIEIETAEIAAIPLFAALSPEAQERVADLSRPLHFDAGHVVVHEGEFAFNCYVITSGAAEVRRGDEAIAVLGPGAVFGEMGVVAGESRRWTRRRAATVITTGPMEAISIDGADLRRLSEEIPALREALRAVAARRDT